MMKIIKPQMTPGEKAEQENAAATAQKSADLIEYLAMMTDVEIPTEEEGTDNE